MSDSPSDPYTFEPIPSATRRRDGWTPERQRGFIAALARIGMVEAAAASIGMSRKSAYALLERAGPDSGFAAAWAAAQQQGRGNAFLAAAERSGGVEVPHFYRGVRCGTDRVYNDGLLLAALQAGHAQGWDRRGPGVG
ncbi:MAG TPA: hypothetical protein VF589_06990 [Allosphingosinicella sp.]|jgi:hypothetical protein